MKNRKKYINKKFKNKWLIDRLVITHRAYFPHLKLEDFKTTRTYFKKTSTHINVFKANLGPGVNITFESNHNLVRYLREYLIKISGIKRMGSLYSHSDNFIPNKLRDFIKEERITNKRLRKRAYRRLFKDLTSIDKSFSGKIKSMLIKGKTTNQVRCSYSLKEAEVCFDFLTPRGVFLTHDRAFTQAMQEHVSRYDEKDFISYDGRSNINSLYESYGKERKAIYGETDHKTDCKFYVKEISPDNILHRFENTFKKKSLKKHLGKLTFNSTKDLKKKFSVLSKISFSPLYDISNHVTEPLDSSMDEVIRSYCDEFFGKHSKFAYSDLTTGNRCIGTGKKSKSNEYVKRKALQLAREGKFVKKKKTAQYNLDKNWIKRVCSI